MERYRQQDDIPEVHIGDVDAADEEEPDPIRAKSTEQLHKKTRRERSSTPRKHKASHKIVRKRKRPRKKACVTHCCNGYYIDWRDPRTIAFIVLFVIILVFIIAVASSYVKGHDPELCAGPPFHDCVHDRPQLTPVEAYNGETGFAI